jgi:hypothetical protein
LRSARSRPCPARLWSGPGTVRWPSAASPDTKGGGGAATIVTAKFLNRNEPGDAPRYYGIVLLPAERASYSWKCSIRGTQRGSIAGHMLLFWSGCTCTCSWNTMATFGRNVAVFGGGGERTSWKSSISGTQGNQPSILSMLRLFEERDAPRGRVPSVGRRGDPNGSGGGAPARDTTGGRDGDAGRHRRGSACACSACGGLVMLGRCW